MRDPNKLSLAESYHQMFTQIKHSWEKNGGKICTIAGTTGLFLTGLHTARKTYKIHDELAENGHQIRLAGIRKESDGKFTRAGRVIKTTLKCAAKTSKHYVGDMVGYALSAYCTQHGYHIEHQNYQNMVAFSGLLAADFLSYRQNVISEHGEEADLRYLTTKRSPAKPKAITEGDKSESAPDDNSEAPLTIQVDPGLFKIRYSRYTTPMVWSNSYALRMSNLQHIVNELNRKLLYAGQYDVNDVRKEFYGAKGVTGLGGIFGRIFEPGNPEHPEYGAMVNLHYEDDRDFMDGITDECWIIIDVDPKPLFEREQEQRDKYQRFTEVEMPI